MSRRKSKPLQQNVSISSESEVEENMANSFQNHSACDSYISFLRAINFDPKSDDGQDDEEYEESYDDSMSSNKTEIEPEIVFKQVVTPNRSSKSHLGLLPKAKIISIPSKFSEVVLLQHPSTITLHGYVRVSVCLGTISINGFNLKEKDKCKVFSTESTGLKQVYTVDSVQKVARQQFIKKMRKMMGCETKNELAELLDNIGPCSVVFLVTRLELPNELQFLQLYYPKSVQIGWTETKKQNDSSCSFDESYTIEINDNFEYVGTKIQSIITECTDEISDEMKDPLCIMVWGAKNSGKSTLLRYLINCTLNNVSEVFYLDTDVGQTEFTPPGTISLTRITEPLLGAPFTHQKTPIKMTFTGSVTPKTLTQYLKSVAGLMKVFKRKFPQSILFVNTMGWIHDLGAIYLNEIHKIVNPSMLIKLLSSDVCSEFKMEEISEDNGNKNFNIEIPVKIRPNTVSHFNATELRNFAFVSYFGQCIKSYQIPNLINKVTPYEFRWNCFAFSDMINKIAPFRLIEAMTGSIVALCYVHESSILKSEIPELPATLTTDAINECFGFGLVTAVDEGNQMVYIVTPLSLKDLEYVNVIIKGDILGPGELILNQVPKEIDLPFTNVLAEAKTPSLKTVRKRAFRNTLTKTPPRKVFRNASTPLTN